MPFFLAVGMFFIPESPRWLILQGRVEEGRKALKWLRPTGVETDVEFTEIQDAIARERELGSDVGIVDMFKNPIDRRRTFLSIAGITTQAASGSMFVICENIHCYYYKRLGGKKNIADIFFNSIQGLFFHHGEGIKSIRDELRSEYGRPSSARGQFADYRPIRSSPCTHDEWSRYLRSTPVDHRDRVR